MIDDGSAGFKMTEFPMTSAAADIPVKIASGKFHGAMMAETPFGVRAKCGFPSKIFTPSRA